MNRKQRQIYLAKAPDYEGKYLHYKQLVLSSRLEILLFLVGSIFLFSNFFHLVKNEIVALGVVVVVFEVLATLFVVFVPENYQKMNVYIPLAIGGILVIVQHQSIYNGLLLAINQLIERWNFVYEDGRSLLFVHSVNQSIFLCLIISLCLFQAIFSIKPSKKIAWFMIGIVMVLLGFSVILHLVNPIATVLLLISILWYLLNLTMSYDSYRRIFWKILGALAFILIAFFCTVQWMKSFHFVH
ncbi:hypothetical protein P261_01706 [Lachnospiraceae bacterium TWA4]|nr:hypothetical protein P261_01706 [Lachnospiraceae bacterium TWA4]